MNKPLDMADKYDSTIHEMDTIPVAIKIGKFGLPDLCEPVYEDVDDEPTVRMQVPTFARQVVEEKKDPRMGLIIILAVCVPFWSTVAYFLFH